MSDAAVVDIQEPPLSAEDALAESLARIAEVEHERDELQEALRAPAGGRRAEDFDLDLVNAQLAKLRLTRPRRSSSASSRA